MYKLLKWLAACTLALAALSAVAASYVYLASEALMARTYNAPLLPFNAPRDAISIEKGQRLATIYGCRNCHSANLEGSVMHDEPAVVRIAAPNITAIAKQYSDAELERLIRRGIKRDGKSVWIMPSPMYNQMSDEDLGAIIAYVKSVPETDGIAGGITLRRMGRIGVVLGKVKPAAVDAENHVYRVASHDDDPLSRGKYLAITACTECHGANLEGWDLAKAPSLIVASAYSEDDFTRLMRTGVGAGGRQLGLMGEMGRQRFSALTEEEVRALRLFLTEFARTRAAVAGDGT
jgi:cytochrome c553